MNNENTKYNSKKKQEKAKYIVVLYIYNIYNSFLLILHEDAVFRCDDMSTLPRDSFRTWEGLGSW